MPLADNPGYRSGMVDLQSGRISREIFVNDAIYQQELERLFARAWLFVGHESQIPNPGDFVVSGMGEESVILCRDRAGQVHVFLNSCRHRGTAATTRAIRPSSPVPITAGAMERTGDWRACRSSARHIIRRSTA